MARLVMSRAFFVDFLVCFRFFFYLCGQIGFKNIVYETEMVFDSCTYTNIIICNSGSCYVGFLFRGEGI